MARLIKDAALLGHEAVQELAAVARHFSVSDRVVWTELVNKERLSREDILGADEAA